MTDPNPWIPAVDAGGLRRIVAVEFLPHASVAVAAMRTGTPAGTGTAVALYAPPSAVASVILAVTPLTLTFKPSTPAREPVILPETSTDALVMEPRSAGESTVTSGALASWRIEIAAGGLTPHEVVAVTVRLLI